MNDPSFQEALLGVVRDLAARPELSDVLSSAARLMENRFPAYRVSVVLLDALNGVGYIALQDRPIDSLRVQLADYPELRHVMTSREPLVIGDLFGDELMRGVRGKLESLDNPMRSSVLFPLLHKEEVVGALFMRSRALRPAVDPDLVTSGRLLASIIALSLGSAITHDVLRREQERSDREIEGLKQFSELFEQSHDGIVITDRQGFIRYLNNAAARVVQRRKKELFGERFVTLLSDRSVTLAERALRGDAVGDAYGYVDLLVRRRDASDAVISAAIRAVERPDGVLITFRDVTELREIESELRQTKDFLENLIQSSVDAIIAADIDGRIILFNRAAEQLLGYSAREAVGRMSVRDLYPEGEAADVMRRLRSEGYGGRGRLELMRRDLLAKDGEAVPVNLTAAIIYEDDREIATVGIFTDLRERVRMEEKLSHVQKKLQMTERQSIAIELAGAAAHELNQPLTSILGYAEMIKSRIAPDDKNRKGVEVICRETERMASIVRKIGQITAYKTQSYVGASTIMDFEETAGRTRIRRETPTQPGVANPLLKDEE